MKFQNKGWTDGPFCERWFPIITQVKSLSACQGGGVWFDDGVGQGVSSTRFLIGGTLKGNPAKIVEESLKNTLEKD